MTTKRLGDDRGRGAPWRILGWGGAAALLTFPFWTGAPWSAGDYVAAGVMVGTIGLGLQAAARWRADAFYRAGAAVALVTAMTLIWVNGAVGIIGSEREDANLSFGSVVLVALVGAAAARFRPGGMARAMAAAAAVQAAVPLIVATLGPETAVSMLSPDVLGATALFGGMWMASAGLFRRAAARSGAA